MSKICFINGSPHHYNSSTHFLITKVTDKFTWDTVYDEVLISDFLKDTNKFSKLINFNHLVLCSPVYVDAIPAQMLEFLVRLEEFLKNNHHEQFNVSALINCGFLEGHQTKIALEIFKNFANRISANWKIGIGIGAGGLLKNSSDYYKKINKPVIQALVKLSNVLVTGQNYSKKIVVANPRLSRYLFKLSSNRVWISLGKKNNLTKNEIVKTIKYKK